MNERTLNIVESAFKRFANYGVNKTSMTEIASDANVARQTLYNAFESKEALISAALKHYGGKTRSDIERDCVQATSMDARLEVLFKHMGVIPFEAMQHLPHLDEVLEIGDSLPPEEQETIRANYLEAVRLALLPFEVQIEAAGILPSQLHRHIKATFKQIKREATSVDELRALFEPLRAMILFCAAAR
ncbi:MAG: TetR/AcrR family transcriptional regulator [Litoreibacter sp.]|nr:TetR/AcrR family transcriptional regulator [Litoreibacter sp.]